MFRIRSTTNPAKSKKRYRTERVLMRSNNEKTDFRRSLFLLISIFRNTYKIYRSTKDDLFQGLAIGFLAGHIGMITHALTANTFILIRIMEPYWLLAAMILMIPKIEEQQKKNKENLPNLILLVVKS